MMDETPLTFRWTSPRTWPFIAVAIAAVTGLIGLAGWVLDVPTMRAIHAKLPVMMPSTGLGLVIAAVGLFILLTRPALGFPRLASGLFALVIFGIGLTTLLGYVSSSKFSVDAWLFSGLIEKLHPKVPTRASYPSAIGFVLVGCALLLHSFGGRKRQKISEVCAVVVILIGLLALIGFVCNVPQFYGVTRHAPSKGMALHTMIGLLALGAGLLCLHPGEGLMKILTSASGSGIMARRLLLAPVLIPLVTGLVQIYGRRWGIYNAEIAGWLFAFLNIAVFTFILWWTARLLYSAESVRDRAEAANRALKGELEQRVEERTAELQRTMNTLTESEERYRALTELSPQIIWMSAADGTLMYANESWSRYSGLSLEATQRAGWTTMVAPQHLERVLAAWHASRAAGGVFEVEVPLRRGSDGSYRWHLVRALPLREGGTIKRWLGIAVDIDDRRRAAEVLEKLNVDLEERVAIRTAQLAAANTELEAFSYSVSHDLRAPLRHIDGFVDILRHDTTCTFSESGQRYLKLVSEAAMKLGKLIDDLLAFSRMGRTEMHQSPLKMEELVNEAWAELAPDRKDRQVNFDVGPLPTVRVDRSMMKQVWINLLGNAIKYTARSDPAEIAVRCRQSLGHEVHFTVQDNGAGFDMQHVGKLFGVFQRLHATKEFPGTGIGLANVQRIVQRHGGRVWAEGKVNEGATFHFTLPNRVE